MQILTTKEVVGYIRQRTGLRVTLSAIYRWIKLGILPAIRVGKRYAVRLDDLEAFIYDPQKERGGAWPSQRTN